MDAMSVSQLAEIAQSVPFNPNVRLRYWIATVESVLKQVSFLFVNGHGRWEVDRKRQKSMRGRATYNEPIFSTSAMLSE